ncbi:MAG TPA: Arc family DNA-binding protein [Noviherbaspirillum sp.]|nr:Arc family DNA-binding protein [Noviherbaspirillum sp.]
MYRSQFRLPHSLYEQLKAASERSGRSLNAELVHRLAQSLSSNGTQPPQESTLGGAEIDALAEKLAQPNNRAELKAILEVIAHVSRKTTRGR